MLIELKAHFSQLLHKTIQGRRRGTYFVYNSNRIKALLVVVWKNTFGISLFSICDMQLFYAKQAANAISAQTPVEMYECQNKAM